MDCLADPMSSVVPIGGHPQSLAALLTAGNGLSPFKGRTSTDNSKVETMGTLLVV